MCFEENDDEVRDVLWRMAYLGSLNRVIHSALDAWTASFQSKVAANGKVVRV